MFDKIYINNKVLGTALNGMIVKNDVIQNNIANVDTPDYKKRVVDFETSLKEELINFTTNGSIDFTNIKPRVNITSDGHRLDGNNVDLNVEMVELNKNAVRYDTLVQSVTSNYNRINSVFNK